MAANTILSRISSKTKTSEGAGAALLAVLFLLFPVALVVNHSTTKNEISVGSSSSSGNIDVLNHHNYPDESSVSYAYQEAGLLMERNHKNVLTAIDDIKKISPNKDSAQAAGKVLKVHIVPHTHDDVGWLKTVDQYYYGLNNTIQHASVKYILDTTVRALLENPKRTFTYVEIAYFSMWWNEQTPDMQAKVQTLVKNGQLVFVNGGWCMHDEAATHYMGMVDQTTRGHAFLSQHFDGYTPRVGWQLDPFGHSSTQASYMSSEMGFDSLFFGRIDYQDLNIRHNTSQCEGVWRSSPENLKEDSQVFWGLTGSYGGNYGAPGGFENEAYNNDEPLVEGYNVEEHMSLWLEKLMWQATRTQGDHIMLTMGSDFWYENAFENFERLDKMIKFTNEFSVKGKFDSSQLQLGNYTSIHAFYSDPATYTAAKFEEQELEPKTPKRTWQLKTDDFFPYSDCDDCFWTGYFTSRPALKRLERVGSSFLHAARQVEAFSSLYSIGRSEDDADNDNNDNISPLDTLEDGVSILQHHDGVSGTSKQHVADDYAKRVDDGMQKATSYLAKLLSQKVFGASESDGSIAGIGQLTYCPLLNESICELTQDATALLEDADDNERIKGKDGDGIYVVAYNALAQKRSEVIKVPVSSDQIKYVITQVDAETSNSKPKAAPIESVVIPNPNFASKKDAAPFHLYFEAAGLAPLTATTFLIQMSKTEESNEPSTKSEDDTSSVLEDVMKHLSMDFGYYTSYAQPKGQKSGAYIFRPNETAQELNMLADADAKVSGPDIYTSNLVSEMHTKVSPWVKYVTRMKKGAPYVEVEYTVGPIPIDDNVGKEVVVRYGSRDIINHGVFYTDSNGREFLKRKLSHRPTWELEEHQPVAGNYYPVNAAIYVEGENYHKSMAVFTDRSQGGSISLNKNGTIDLMVHRRTVADDSRGVGEPINETDGGMTPYPPYGNRERQGKGLVITGIHRILISNDAAVGGAALARSQMDQAFSPVHLFFAKKTKKTSANTNNHLKKTVPSSSATLSKSEAALPSNLMLTTFMALPSSTIESVDSTTAPSSRSYLVRIGHQYASGEGPLGKTELVDMKVLFPNSNHDQGASQETISMEEMTLSGNQLREDWENKRYHWRTPTSTFFEDADETTPSTSTACALFDDTATTTFRIMPMKICTFVVTFTANEGEKSGSGETAAVDISNPVAMK